VGPADPVTYDDDGNVISLSERFNSEQEDIRYSREISQDEVKNAPVSFGITKLNDYIHVQNQVFLTLMREGFFNENNRRIVTNRDSKKDIEIGKRGIEETFGKGNRFQNLPRILKELKLAAVRLIPDMIENGEIVDADVSNKHNGKSGITYSYIKSNLTVDGTTYPVYIDIRQSPQKNMFWVHSIRTEKSQRLGAGSDNTDNDAVNEPLTSKLDDTTSGEKVNTQNEKHSREVDPTVLAELDRAEKNGSSRNSIELDPGVIDTYYNSLPISKKEQPERKISKTRTNTYELSGFFDKVINDLKDADEGMYAYDVVHEKQTTDAARERLLADFEGKADFLNGKARGRTADLPIFIGRFFYL
jgi:hypothetical protein